jgi:hypothetical protein
MTTITNADQLLAFNATLPSLALEAAKLGDIHLARSYIRVAKQRGVQCGEVERQIESTAERGKS